MLIYHHPLVLVGFVGLTDGEFTQGMSLLNNIPSFSILNKSSHGQSGFRANMTLSYMSHWWVQPVIERQ